MNRIRSKKQSGFSSLEILLALTLLVLTMTAVISVIFGNQSVAADSQTNAEALHKAREILENAMETSRNSFDSVVTAAGTYTNGITYNTLLDIPLGTKCFKYATSTVTWTGDHNRPQKVILKTQLTNVPEMLASGGNCDTSPPSGGWNPPATWASSNFNPGKPTGKPTGMDVLNKLVYMTGDNAPFLFIADTNGAAFGQSSGLFVNFANGFSDGAQLNDIKVTRASNGKVYAYVARNTSSNQFEVIDVNDIRNPNSIIKLSLTGVSGANPQGWRVYYYDGKAYVVARFTAGPELHVFDVSTSWDAASIREIGSGTELGLTVEDFVVTKQTISGSPHYIAYMATDDISHELLVMDVTMLTATAIPTPAGDLPGAQNGASVYLMNNFLYFGRDSTPGGSDLYIFKVQDPQNITIKNQQDINTGVIGIAVSGQFAFLGTPKASKEFQVWTSDPNSALNLISPFKFPNVISSHSLRYESNWTYVAGSGSGNDALRIFYSP